MRTIFRGLITAGASAFALISCSTARVAAEELTQSFRFSANGPTLILSNWTCWYADCRYAPCHMTVVQKPTLGSLTPTVRHGVFPASSGQCAGKPSPILNITFTPRAGAHGSDDVVLRSMSENGSRHTLNIHIDVP
jgi:hypothetical protein